ncbi:MAG: hypothetical protein WBA16_01630 [Nonlabens sp.]
MRLEIANRNFKPDYGNYSFSKHLDSESWTPKENSYLSQRQEKLIAKTLIALFGSEIKNPLDTSIRYSNNLQKLLQQKPLRYDIIKAQFNRLINFEGDFKFLEKELNANNIQPFLDRMIFFSAGALEELTRATMILIYIYNHAEKFGVYDVQLLQILNDVISNRFANRSDEELLEEEKMQLWQRIDEIYLQNPKYDTYKRLRLLGFISTNRYVTGLMTKNNSQEILEEKVLSIFKQFLEKKNKQLWQPLDFTFYHAYHAANKFFTSEILAPLVSKFWNNNDVTLLCSKMLENDSFTIKMFKLAEHAKTIFGSFQDFHDFVAKRLKVSSHLKDQEYLKYLELQRYVKYERFIRFEFTAFDEIQVRMDRIKELNR